jgi:hypothetical protein
MCNIETYIILTAQLSDFSHPNSFDDVQDSLLKVSEKLIKDEEAEVVLAVLDDAPTLCQEGVDKNGRLFVEVYEVFTEK